MAFDSIVGIAVFGFDVSYAIPILLKLIYSDSFPDTQMSLGPMSRTVNIVSVVWLLGTSILLFFPTTYPITLLSMNWTVVVVGGFSFISLVYWFVYAKDNFRGPKRGKNDVVLNEADPLLMR